MNSQYQINYSHPTFYIAPFKIFYVLFTEKIVNNSALICFYVKLGKKVITSDSTHFSYKGALN